jgi:LmbE family N-acetylglucosaminyl deacetylase
MSKQLKLMCILAHPDDESLGMGGSLAKYAAEGVETYLLTATRGERGWLGQPEDYPGAQALGLLREAELRAAAQVLGLQEVVFLDYPDGELDQAEPGEAIGRIVKHIRRLKPQVVLTFDPYGSYGHPDHIAISQFTMAAVVASADPTYVVEGSSKPHRVSKLYYRVATSEKLAAYQAAFGDLAMCIDGCERRAVGWEPWAITTDLDIRAYGSQIWQAVACHRSQLPATKTLAVLAEEHGQNLWRTETYCRSFSLVNGGRKIEDDLFAGLR